MSGYIAVAYYAFHEQYGDDIFAFQRFIMNTVRNQRDVETLCMKCSLSKEQMDMVQRTFRIPKRVLLKKRDEINWGLVYEEYETFTDEIVYELKDYIDFHLAFMMSMKVTEKCLRGFVDLVDMKVISSARAWSFEFLDDYKDALDWHEVTIKFLNDRKISWEFLDRYADCLDWDLISTYSNLCMTDDMLERYVSKLDWSAVTVWRRWSYNSLHRFWNRLNLNILLKCGNVYWSKKLEKMIAEQLESV